MAELSLQVEVLAGTPIRRAALEARSLARKLDLAYVQFNFNGVEINIGKNADCDVVESKYMGVLHSHLKFVVEDGR